MHSGVLFQKQLSYLLLASQYHMMIPSKRAHARYYDVVLLYVMYMMFFQTNGICEIS